MADNHKASGLVCNDCETLIVDILSGSTCSNDRWQDIGSEHAVLSYSKSHLDGKIRTLQQSNQNGCKLCRCIYKKVSEVNQSGLTSSYYLFVWRPARVCQVQIAIEDIRTFVKHVAERKSPESLTFYGRLASQPTLPILRNLRSVSRGTRPLLSTLPTQHSGSTAAFQQARSWLAECKSSHSECSRPQSRLPKRVLDLGQPDEPLKISLYETKGEKHPYVCLSYCWGEADRLVASRNTPGAIVTQQRSQIQGPFVIKHLKPEPQPDTFPKTLKDAIRVAKELKFQFIWIDSMCILQGDKLDWAHQAAAMTDIYGGSTLTISATSNVDSSQNFLRVLPNDKTGVGNWSDHDTCKKSLEIFVGEQMETLDLEEEKISTRGWVFQERLVSIATLHYTDKGMVWECAHGTHLEHDQNVSSVPWKADWRDVMKTPSSNISSTDRVDIVPYQVWYEWISAYSERTLWNSQDKFPAIAGVAKQFAKVFGLNDQTYMAGLWSTDFAAGLLWCRFKETKTLIPLKDKYVAPSWSWGSVEGRLEYRIATLTDSLTNGSMLKVLGFNVKEKEKGTYGLVLPSASVRVQGLLQAVTVDRQSHPGVQQKPHQKCGISKGFVNNVNVLCMLDEYVESALRYHQCWCLRIGSYHSYGREADVFLLLDHVSQSKDEFCRIGFVESDAWWDRMSPTLNSGLLISPRISTLTLI